MRVLLSTLILTVMLAAPVVAQAPAFSAEVNATRIGLDDTLIYRLTFRGIADPIPPELRDLDGFRLLHRSQSSTFEFVNSRSTYTSTFIYYLRPLRTGTLAIPAAHTVAEGRQFQTDSFAIEVVRGAVLPPPPRPTNPFASPWDDTEDPFPAAPQPADAGEVKLEADLSKRSVVIGEPVIYTVRLLTQQSVESVNLLSAPSFSGFWQEWLPVPTTVSGKTEVRAGKTFQVFDIRRAILFPSQAGLLEIPALQFEVSAGGGLAMFGASHQLERATPPLKLQVKPPPPAARGLPVGNFRLQVGSDRPQADAAEFYTVTVRLSGDGNVKTITAPTLPTSPDYRTYPAKVASQFDPGPPPVGTLTAEIPVAFLRTGTVTIPALEFRSFDPVGQRVVTVRSEPFAVTVGGQVGPAAVPAEPGRAAAQETLAPAIAGPLPADPVVLPFGSGYWPLLALPFLLPLGALLRLHVWRPWRQAHPRQVRDAALQAALALLRQATDRGDIAPCFERYLGLRGDVPAASLTGAGIADLLEAHAVPTALRRQFLELWEETARLRYSPSSGANPAGNWRGEAERLLRAIDGAWR